jgi:hypothetical protein
MPPPALAGAGLESLPAIIYAQSERAPAVLSKFFTASIRNRNAGVRLVKCLFDRCEQHHSRLEDIDALAIAAYVQLSPCCRP